jgi:RNA recognition motif-containing protein
VEVHCKRFIVCLKEEQVMKNSSVAIDDIEAKDEAGQDHTRQRHEQSSVHHNWFASLYQSLVNIVIGALFFVLNVFQEFLQSSIGGKAIHVLEEVEETLKSASSLQSSLRVPPAGEEQPLQNNKAKVPSGEHHGAAVDVEREKSILMEIPPTPHIAKPEEDIGATSNILVVSASEIEPSLDQSKNTLVIKNLPFKFKPIDLDKLLSDHQTHPKNVRLLRDNEGRFTGMAFIRCPSKEEAQRLIKSMNGLEIGGRNIQVEFKLKKKKKSKLTMSTESVSSLNSSSDGLPVASELHMSGEDQKSTSHGTHDVMMQNSAPITSTGIAPVPLRRGRKLAASAENSFGGNGRDDKFKNPPQIRRKSTSVIESVYAYSALSKAAPFGTSIRPVRQPTGPDGKTNGFYDEYRQSRTMVHA